MNTKDIHQGRVEECDLTKQEVSNLTRIVRDVQKRFPETIRLDELKVVEELDDELGVAVETTRAGVVKRYIYIEKQLLERNDWLLEAVIAHEMAHIYFYQNGRPEMVDGHPYFEWVCGRVCAIQTDFTHEDHTFKELIVPFMKEEGTYEDN